MAAGKRLYTSDPLNEHDVAERLDKAALRALRILMEVRQTEGLFEAVRESRYHTNVVEMLGKEIAEHWSYAALVIHPSQPRPAVPTMKPLPQTADSDAEK